MAKNRKTPDMNLPMWFDGQNINEALFCEEFLQERRIINFACLKELRQIAGKELRQKSFSGVIIRNQGMIQRILCETDR